MAGIAGLFYPATPKPVDPSRIAAMTDALAHRGPDGEGNWTAPGVGLGHRGIARVDAAAGPQPVATPDLGHVAAFDGQIHNAAALRTELKGLGAKIRTGDSAELLLHAWRLWGAGMLDRIDGAFAIALYDADRRGLFLARDRLGEKPLLYTEMSDGALAFASELKGLRGHPMFRSAADFRAIDDYLALGYVPDDASVLSAVRKLPAGHFLWAERGKPVGQPVKWWDVDFARRTVAKRKDLEAEFAALLRDAIRVRTEGEATPGALLDGGLDDASIVALMAEASKKAVRTVGQGSDTSDLADPAAPIAARFATRHTSRPAGEDGEDFDALDAIADAFDEPYGDPAALTQWLLCRFAAPDLPVALTGEGADCALAGAPRHRAHAAAERVRALIPDEARARTFGALGNVWPGGEWMPARLRAKPALLALAQGGEFAYPHAMAAPDAALRHTLYTPSAQRIAGEGIERRIADTMRLAPARDGLDRAQYADFVHYVPAGLLARLDRIGMASGLALRAPMLDHRLVQFAASLPVKMRIRGGQGKCLLRAAMAPYLPKEIVQSRTRPPGPPVGEWMRNALGEDAAALGRSRTLSATGWFDMKAIETLAAEHRAGRADHGALLWRMLMLDRSLRRLLG